MAQLQPLTAEDTPPSAQAWTRRPQQRVMFLDTLRFMAAGAVLLQHIAEVHSDVGRWLTATLSPGVFGVVLFFLVSGFVIPMTLRADFNLRDFALRRVFRIYPLAVAAFIAVALLGYGTGIAGFAYVRSASAFDWLANLLLIQDYVGAQPLLGVTWTLSIEFAWYGVFAATVLLRGQDFDRWLVMVAPLLLLALVILSFATGQRLPLARIGMVYAAIIGCRAWRAWSGALPTAHLLRDATVFVLVMATANLVSFGYFSHPTITLYQALLPWMAAPALFVAVTALPWLNRHALLNNQLTSWLGEISYSTYLLHPIAIGLAAWLATDSLFVALSLVLTLLLSVLGYRLVERPGQALGKAIGAALHSNRAAAPSPAPARRRP